MIILYLTIWESTKLYSKSSYTITYYWWMRLPISPCPFQYFLLSFFFFSFWITAMLVVKQRYLMILIHISLMTNDVSMLSCAYWSFTCLLEQMFVQISGVIKNEYLVSVQFLARSSLNAWNLWSDKNVFCLLMRWLVAGGSLDSFRMGATHQKDKAYLEGWNVKLTRPLRRKEGL
jgi:hypothetical protein